MSDAKLKKDKAFDLALDPTRPLTAPQNLTAVPYFNFAPLKNAIVRLETAASDLDEKLADVAQDGEASEALNRKLYLSERQNELPGTQVSSHPPVCHSANGTGTRYTLQVSTRVTA